MLTEPERRAAALAVIRYGVDKARVKEVARSVQRAQAEGQPADIVTALVDEKLLSPGQAEEIRAALDRTQIGVNGPRLASGRAKASLPHGKENSAIRQAGSPDLRQLGAYQILRRLGEGGMGSVYLGYHEETGKQVAIKVLSDQLAGNRAYVDRFQREARSVLHLDHANIVRGIAVGADAATGAHFIVLEYVDGPSAHALLDRFGRLAVGDAVHIILDVARALEHAHARNVIHRDIKPDNILLSPSGVAKLADLGLARRIDEESQLTGAREGFGTPYYMPYEQSINAREADGRSDIYALGATLYHLLTGEVPFPGKGPLEVAEKKRLGDFPLASTVNPGVPRTLDQILSKMLAHEPGERYQTTSELIVDLERSSLAAAVPSFVDPDVALQDPLVQARLTIVPEPTQLDLGRRSAAQSAPAEDPEIWYLRHRNKEGRWRKARASTKQIKERLQLGRMPPSVEASHDPKGEYRLLEAYVEFRQVNGTHTERTEQERDGSKETPPSQEENDARLKPTPAKRRQLLWLLPVGLILFITVAVLTYYLTP